MTKHLYLVGSTKAVCNPTLGRGDPVGNAVMFGELCKACLEWRYWHCKNLQSRYRENPNP